MAAPARLPRRHHKPTMEERMGLKVIQWATGGVGRESLRHILSDPALELVGVFTYSGDKAGRDAGELCGMPHTGVKASNDRDAILALPADCVIYAPLNFTNRPMEAENNADIEALLASGKNVISVVSSIWPWVRSAAVAARLEAACAKGGTTLYGTGINPGYLLCHLALSVSGLCQRIDHIKLRENWDAASFNSPELLFEMVGFAKPAGWLTLDSPGGVMMAAWFNEQLSAAVHAMGGTVDRFERAFEYGLATRDIDIVAGHIPKGTIAAVGWTWTAIVDGKPFASVTDRWIADWDIPGWGGPRTHYWQIEIQGAPSVVTRLEFADTYPPLPQGMVAGDRVTVGTTAAVAVNAIPAICAAPPGIARVAPASPCRLR
jgi:hypothetical protein